MTYNSSKTGAQVDSVVDAGLPGGSTLYGVSNLLGTVSESAGVPTGAVIETNTGNGGRYVRYADGTQICWHSFTPTTNVGSAVNSLYRTGHTGMTFAAEFVAAPQVTATLRDQGGAFNLWVQGSRSTSTTATSVQLLSTSPTPAFTGVTVEVIAIGRWF